MDVFISITFTFLYPVQVMMAGGLFFGGIVLAYLAIGLITARGSSCDLRPRLSRTVTDLLCDCCKVGARTQAAAASGRLLWLDLV